MKKAILYFVFVPFILISCQREETASVEGLERGGLGVPTVEGSDGKIYSVPCIRDNRQVIEQQGKTALNDCQVTLSSVSESQRGRLGHNQSSYSIVYPSYYYYNPSYQSYAYNYSYVDPFLSWVIYDDRSTKRERRQWDQWYSWFNTPTYSYTYYYPDYSYYYPITYGGGSYGYGGY